MPTTMSSRGTQRSNRLPLLRAVAWHVTTLMLLYCHVTTASKVRGHGIYKDNSISTYYNFAVQRQQCKEKSLEENARLATLIFTGTVKDVQPDAKVPGQETAEVEVKRVIKGASLVDQLPAQFVEGKFVRHRVVTVRGIGRDDVCISHVRKHDTWIFFARFVPPDGLMLNSSLLRISLTNIAHTEAAVKDKNYVSKNADHAVSCHQTSCPFGGQCMVNHHTQSIECKCIETCEDVVSPVCGSDNKTYDNECQLRVASCAQRRRIRIRWNDSCEFRDPCRNIKCGFGAKCVPSPDSLSFSCQCPDNCADYGFEATDEEKAMSVCGENGIEYDSLCHLHRTSCLETRHIKIQHFGKCDPCWNVRCDFYAVCTTNESSHRPTCVCLSNCSEDSNLVCGSNGLTYRSRCEMELASCRSQQEIPVEHTGPCVPDGVRLPTAGPCDYVDCKYGAQCRNGSCSCPTFCPVTEDPVCASDHVTYENECVMLRTACYQSRSTVLTVVHAGDCVEMSGSEEVCDDDRCQFGGTCEYNDEDELQCVCNFDCGAIRSLVCGSDGMTYSNECYMKEAACKKQTAIRPESTGHCQEFEEDLCDGNEILVNPQTMLEYDCAPGGDSCPKGSYCHIINDTARCCVGSLGQPTSFCEDTKYGCCLDGTTVAMGPGLLGCSMTCRCHPLGSYGEDCDPVNGQCSCKTGVGGPRCDRCEPTYWGMPKIAEGNDGCIPCGCNMNGSIRDDCEQMNGQCICKRFVYGPKCDLCADGTQVTDVGCPANETLIDGDILIHDDSLYFEKATVVKSSTEEEQFSTFLSSTVRPTPVDYVIPSFSGMSYIILKKLQHGNRDMSIEIELRPLSPNGIVFYTGKNDDGSGDFVSIALRNGYVEFRYDLGSGPAMLRTNQQVTLKKLHKITATRYGKDGLLKLDKGSEASAVSPGALRSLNFGTPIYLGYVPNLTEQISKNAGANSGFVGCIQLLRIASSELNKEYELSKAISSDIEADNEITECDRDSCKTVLCSNGGICVHQDPENYTCSCPSGYTGDLCDSKASDDL